MPHVRTQIRLAVASALELDLSGYDVFSSRKFPRNALSRPMIDMRFANENVDTEVMGGVRHRTASLYIRIQRQAKETEVDNLLDGDEVAVNAVVMESGWYENLLIGDPELMQVNWSDEAPISAIVLRYDMLYRVTQTDPETARG